MSHAVYKQLHPPTAVNLCAKSNFTSADALNLLVAKANVLEIYTLKFKGSSQDEDQEEFDRLELTCHFELFGNIESMCPVRFPTHKRDSLILSFRDAKVSVVDFDRSTNDLRTISLHYLEDDFLKDGKVQFVLPPIVKLAPHNRCAGLIVYDTKLILLPIRQSESAFADEAIINTNLSGDSKKEDLPVQQHVMVDLKELGLKNIKDFCFLHGYFEPTVLFLHEPEQTWPGRLAMKRNTCVVTAISIDFIRGQYPIIWSVAGLPYDSYRLIPLEENYGGGALVVGANNIFHVNQTANYGMSLNDFGVQPDADLPVALDNTSCPDPVSLEDAPYTFVTRNRILFSSPTGHLWLLYIINDGRSLRSLKIKKTGVTVVASCMCALSEEYIFIGATQGDSSLTQVIEHYESAAVKKEVDADGPGTTPKKRRLEQPKNKSFLDFLDDELDQTEQLQKQKKQQHARRRTAGGMGDDEALREMFGGSGGVDTDFFTSATGELPTYKFHILDQIINVGPIIDFDVGQTAFDEDNSGRAVFHPSCEVVTCSGTGKSGSICILQRNVRPEISSSYDLLKGCVAMWAVRAPSVSVKQSQQGSNNMTDDPSQFHALLIMTFENSTTKVLKIGENIDEITDRARFITNETTLNVGNMFDSTRIVQVCLHTIRVMEGLNILQELSLPDVTVHSSHILNRFALLHLSDGTIQLLKEKDNAKKQLEIITPTLSKGFGRVTAATLYQDYTDPKTGLFKVSPSQDGEDMFVEHFCVVCWSSGSMEIYSVPDFTPVFTFLPFTSMSNTLRDENPTPEDVHQLFHDNPVKYPYVEEVALYSIGSMSENPYLLVLLNNGELFMYRSFAFTDHTTQQKSYKRLSNLRFSKIDQYTDYNIRGHSRVYVGHKHTLASLDANNDIVPDLEPVVGKNAPNYAQVDITTVTPMENVTKAEDGEITTEAATKHFFLETPRRPALVPFDNIAGYKGLFLCGHSPAWFFSERGYIRMHPMSLDGHIRAFTPFHNVGCRYGFIYYNHKAFLKICTLPSGFKYDTAWPTRKVGLLKTPRCVAYHRDVKTYSVVTSREIRDPEERKTIENLDMEIENGRYPKPRYERYEVTLYNSSTWTIHDRIELQEHEQVCSARVVEMWKPQKTGDDSDDEEQQQLPDYKIPKEYIPLFAVATSTNQGEDFASRGRILLFEIVPDEKKFDYDPNALKFKLLYERSISAPATALCQIDGYLAIAAGPKIYVYKFDWEQSQLIPSSFLDVQFYITSMNSIKDYILYGDMYKSAHFLRWREQGHQLTLLAKDYNMLQVVSSDFILYGNTLGLIVSDGNQNIQIFVYDPRSAESLAGKKLVPKADFHVGQLVTKLARMPMMKDFHYSYGGLGSAHAPPAPVGGEDLRPGPHHHPAHRAAGGQPQHQQRHVMGAAPKQVPRHLSLFSTSSGGFGYFAPIDESTYRRLSTLQLKMYTQLPHRAGLHPKAYRLFRAEENNLHSVNKKNVIDGSLLWRFAFLNSTLQRDLARQIGTNADQIMDNIIELDRATEFF